MDRRFMLTASVGVLFCARTGLAVVPGVSASVVRFGQSAAYEGPAAALGSGMRVGLMAAFAEANARGGARGLKLELAGYDDGYEPEATVVNTRRLITEDGVFALIGAVGTPTSAAAVPIAAEAGVPFVGPFTGAEFLRERTNAHVINVRASYFQETEELVERLTTDLGVTRIAAFYQDDSYGRAGLAGIQRALDKRGMQLAAEGTYERNTTAVRQGLLAIRRAAPEAVIMIGAYQPCAEFIKLARQVKLDAVFANVSFVGSEALQQELGEAGTGVLISQVVPLPWDSSMPLVADYQRALAAFDPAAKPGFISLEGYMVGRVAIAAIERIPGEVTREAFLAAVTGSGPIDLGGVTLEYGSGDNQGMDQVFLTMIQADGSFAAIERLSRL
jgi:branched-chain amino acid transport system substrate-binding protein